VFLLPAIFLGLAFALVVGGRPSRLADVRFRLSGLVLLALGLQVVLFSRLGAGIPEQTGELLHLGSYGLLLAFAFANLRLRLLLPVLLGMALNAAAIAANGGHMPISGAAARAAGLDDTAGSNVDQGADRLRFLGDVFALPYQLPYANIFSVGDLLIGFGIIAFLVAASLEPGSGDLSAARVIEPLRVAAYRRLAAGRLISHLGDWLTIAALVGWVYQETRSTAHVAAVMLVRLAPPILGGGIAAFVVDRLPKGRLLVFVELSRGVTVAGALAAVLAGRPILVLAALAISGALAALSNAATPALVPSLLPPEQLPAANAGLGMAKDGAMALGAVTAGLALSLVGVGVALAIDIGTFLVAMVLLSRLPAGEAGPRDEDDGPRPSAVRYLLRSPRLVVLVLSFAAATFATGLTNASLPRLLEEGLGLGSGGYGFGMAALGCGLALGGITVGFARVGPNAGRWIGLGLMLMAGFFVLLGLAEHPPTALLLIGLIGFVDGTTDVLFETSVQRQADARHYGAVFGLASAVMTTTMMSAVALAPLANRFLEARGVVIASSAFLLVAGVIAVLGLSRQRRHEAVEPAVAPFGLQRKGEDLSLVVCGGLVDEAAAAAAHLERELSIEIVALPDEGPWEAADLLRSVRKTSKVLILHENSGREVRAAEVAALIAEDAFEDLDAPVRRVCAPEADVVGALRGLAAY
jgi:predicted MFS family arabinose efflux permease